MFDDGCFHVGCKYEVESGITWDLSTTNPIKKSPSHKIQHQRPHTRTTSPTTTKMPLMIPPFLLPLLSLPPSTYIQTYFALLGAGCLALQLLPALNHALLTYGPRQSSPSSPSSSYRSLIVTLLKQTGLLFHVPHAWFSHFYVALLAFQAFWAAQYLSRGCVLATVAEREVEMGEGHGMRPEQVFLAWGMLTVQGARRLYECWFVMRPSASQMLGVHWVLSLLVYLAMSVSVWIGGSGKPSPSLPPEYRGMCSNYVSSLSPIPNLPSNQHTPQRPDRRRNNPLHNRLPKPTSRS